MSDSVVLFVDKSNKEYILQNDGVKLVTECLSRQVVKFGR